MSRQILSGTTKIEEIQTSSSKKNTSNGIISDRILLKKRSDGYVHLMKSLDTNKIIATGDFSELLEKVKEEFDINAILDNLIGIVSKCYLGENYEVHTLDLVGSIICHYRTTETLPIELEKARKLSLHPSYLFVEVYRDKLICIQEDGSAVIL